jgi:hypothetical protein
MITIKITNADQLVLEKKGWFVAHVVGAVVDLEAQVETVVMERLRASLASEGVEAIIERYGAAGAHTEA